jgi:hypothetical protein
LISFAQVEASREIAAIIAGAGSQDGVGKKEKKRDRLQELLCLVKPAVNEHNTASQVRRLGRLPSMLTNCGFRAQLTPPTPVRIDLSSVASKKRLMIPMQICFKYSATTKALIIPPADNGLYV